MDIRILTVDEISDKLRLGKKTIQKAISSGSLKGYKKHRRWFVFASDLEDWIKSDDSS